MSGESETQVAHLAAALVAVPAAFALERLASHEFVGQWALGSMDLRATEDPGVYRGHSLFDGTETHVEIDAHPAQGLIDYRVGDRHRRVPRISIRVAPGAVAGLGEGACVVSLQAWRHAAADTAGWRRTRTAHETEILLIKGQLEAAFGKEAMA